MSVPPENGALLDAGSPAEILQAPPEEKTRVPLQIEDWLTVIIMALLALITFANVLVRYFTDQSFAWTEEFSVFLMILLAILFFLIAALSVRVVWDDFRFEETSPGIGVPQWWYSIWLPIVCTAIGLRAVGLFIRRSRASSSEEQA